MKKSLISLFLIVLCLAPWACTRSYLLGPVSGLSPTNTPTPTLTSTPTATSTATIVSTPGCGFTVITIPTPVIPLVSSSEAGLGIGNPVPGTDYVIRSLSDWQNYYGSTSAPAPPVNFSTQMILINVQAYTFAEPIPGSPGFGTYPSKVCWTTSGMTVSCLLETYLVPIALPLLPGVTPTPEPVVTQYFVIALVVPISSLPVTWIYTQELNAG
jgi:hypothetical protein